VVDLTAKTPAGERRPPEELEALAAHDPIDRMRRRLLDQGILEEATDDHLQRECARVVAAAVEEARAAPSPDGPQALDNVFSRTQGRG
jgi:TPP-dependent pyruvate/acetoin dehydrogenase alpha subunit